MKIAKLHIQQFVVSLCIGFGIVVIVYASFNLYRSLTSYQIETMSIRAEEAETAGNIEEAIRIRTTIYRTLPDDTENILRLSSLYFALNNFTEAETYAKSFTDAEPLRLDGTLLLGKISLKTGDISSAQQSFSKIYTDNQSREAAYYLGLIAMGSGEDPLPYLEKAAGDPDPFQDSIDVLNYWQNAQNERNPTYKDALIAFYLLEKDQPYIALRLLEKVIETEPEYRDGYYLQGVARAKTGDIANAINSLEKALEIDPDHQASKDALEVIQQPEAEPTPTETEPSPDESLTPTE